MIEMMPPAEVAPEVARESLGATAEAFDRVAVGYDAALRGNPVWLLFRHTLQERLRRMFVKGMRVLDVGCGTGEDALFLAERGVSVHAIDVSPAMVEKARAKAGERRIPSSLLTVEVRGAEDVAGIGASFDGAYSNLGALNCGDLEAAGRGLALVLAARAPILLSWMGPYPLPALVRSGFRERRGRNRPHVGGVALSVRYPGFGEVRQRLGPDFVWRESFALGVLVPPPEFARWPVRHPGLVGLLAGVESLVRGWPLLRGLGDHLVAEGMRR